MAERKLTILYGSQTGEAQDLAEQIWRESKQYHFNGTVTAMDNYDVQTLINESTVIFVCSTTGQGNEPDNMKAFWKFLLRKSLPANSLAGVNYAVLGIGDSSYSYFNFVAKRLNKRLQQLGAHAILPIGLCDEQHDLGLSAVSLPWVKDLWQELLVLSPLQIGMVKLEETPRPFRWTVDVISSGNPGESQSKLDRNLDIFADYTDAVFDKPFVAEVLVLSLN